MDRTVAVCVCTCRRPQQLDRLLRRLAEADLAAARILVVVDNAPGGDAGAVCERLRGQLRLPLRFAEEPVQGIATARNRALEVALRDGVDRVAFLDDDDLPEPDWLRQLVSVADATGADLVFGSARAPADVVVPRHLRRVDPLASAPLERLNRYALPGSAGTHNVLLSRRLVEALRAQGPVFRADLGRTGGSDTELFVRATRQGLSWAAAPGSVIVTGHDPARMTVTGVIRRAYRHGVTQVLVDRIHRPDAATTSQLPSAAWQLVRSVATLPMSLLPPDRLVAQLCKVARAAGKLQALRGRRFSYYS
ncbi:MAG: glycosyltransferase [Geminicoccaceae bacterium]